MPEEYKLVVELLSDALPGSGEGFGAIIDQDVVFDELGIPYIPGKRIKGLLRDSYEEICQLLGSSTPAFKPADFLFGNPGQQEAAPLFISNLYPEHYEKLKNALENLKKVLPNVFTPEAIIEAFAYLRQQTAINPETGTALEHSLRTIRVLKKNLKFSGIIKFEGNTNGSGDLTINYLALACLHIKRFGTKRSRGFGEVKCYLEDNSGNNISEAVLNQFNSGGSQ